MEAPFANYKAIGGLITSQGQNFVEALIILVAGLIAAKILIKLLRRLTERFNLNPAMVSTVSNIFYVILVLIVVAAALQHAGMATVVVRRVLIGISLAVVGLIVIFRPLIPTLPFKVGNTIMTGSLLGKVEATTIINTRIKTFDGKTVFVPNSKILNDYVINYHFTPNRRLQLDVGIGYNQDILRAKQVLEALMIEDPRVLKTPRPVIYVVNLADSCVELSARGWVLNVKYWKTRCDLLEKAKLRLDQEGITIAFPQRDVHLYYKTAPPASTDAVDLNSEKSKNYDYG